MKFPNSYYLRARLWPTLLTSIPIISCYWYFIKPLIDVQLVEIPEMKTVSNVSISAALVFLLIQLNRFLSKEIFQRWYFKDELEMPTTNFILWNDKFFTSETKTLIREKIKNDFAIELYNEEQEKINELNARKQICLAVSQIREVLRGNAMLLRHNIEYGFFRNGLGGCVLAILFSLAGICFSYSSGTQTKSFWLFITLAIIYIIPILLSSFFVNRFGSYYAKILYEQFLSHKSSV